MAAVGLDDELVALLDEPLHHAGSRQVREAIVKHDLPGHRASCTATSHP